MSRVSRRPRVLHLENSSLLGKYKSVIDEVLIPYIQGAVHVHDQ